MLRRTVQVVALTGLTMLAAACNRGNSAANAPEVDPKCAEYVKLIGEVRDELIGIAKGNTEQIVASARKSRKSAAINAMAAQGRDVVRIKDSELEPYMEEAEKATRKAIESYIAELTDKAKKREDAYCNILKQSGKEKPEDLKEIISKELEKDTESARNYVVNAWR